MRPETEAELAATIRAARTRGVGRLDEVRGIAAGTSAAWQVLTPGVPTHGVHLV